MDIGAVFFVHHLSLRLRDPAARGSEEPSGSRRERSSDPRTGGALGDAAIQSAIDVRYRLDCRGRPTLPRNDKERNGVP